MTMISCPHCSGHIAYKPELAGTVAACPLCSKKFRMPGQAPPVVSPSPRVSRANVARFRASPKTIHRKPNRASSGIGARFHNVLTRFQQSPNFRLKLRALTSAIILFGGLAMIIYVLSNSGTEEAPHVPRPIRSMKASPVASPPSQALSSRPSAPRHQDVLDIVSRDESRPVAKEALTSRGGTGPLRVKTAAEISVPTKTPHSSFSREKQPNTAARPEAAQTIATSAPPISASTERAATKQDTKSLAKAAAEAAWKPNSTKYGVAGFKTLCWGDGPDLANSKAREWKLKEWDRQELIFDDNERLVGYSRRYDGELGDLIDIVRETFGTAPDASNSTVNSPDGTDVVAGFSYNFPDTSVGVTLVTKIRPGRVNTTTMQLTLYDRRYLVRTTREILEAIEPGLAVMKASLRAALASREPTLEFPTIPGCIVKTGSNVRGIFNHVQTRRVWLLDKFQGRWHETEQKVFAVDQVTGEYESRSSIDPVCAGYLGMALYVENFANSKEFVLAQDRIGGIPLRALSELAVCSFPSKDGTFYRKNSGGKTWYEWKMSAEIAVKIDCESNEGMAVRITKTPESARQL